MLLRAFKVTRGEEQSTQRDEDVAAPASSPVGREMGQTGGERGCRFGWVQGRGLDHSVHLDRGECEVMGECASGRHEFGELFDCCTTRRFVRLRDDDGEVFGTQEGRNCFLDAIESLLEPLSSNSQFGESLSLS